MKKGIAFMFLLLNLKSFTSEIPNIIIQDNPNRETPIINLEQRDKPTELDINITKLSTEKITASYDKKQDRYYFILSEKLQSHESIFVTNNKDILLKKKIIGKSLDYSYDSEIISIKGIGRTQDIYIVKYNNSTDELIKLYKWDKEVIEIESQNKVLELEFRSEYDPYEEIVLDNSRMRKKIDIVSGDIFKLDMNTESVGIYNTQGELLETIHILSGNGGFGLTSDSLGVTLRTKNGYLMTGIGFRDGNLALKLKEWSSKVDKYEVILKVKSKLEEINYKLILIPPKMGIKIQNNGLNFDFGTIANKSKFISTITNSVDVTVPKDITSISAKFSEEYDEATKTGKMTLFREGGDETIKLRMKIEGIVNKGEGLFEGTKLYNVSISSKLDEDINSKPNGVYKGQTEMIITIDS